MTRGVAEGSLASTRRTLDHIIAWRVSLCGRHSPGVVPPQTHWCVYLLSLSAPSYQTHSPTNEAG